MIALLMQGHWMVFVMILFALTLSLTFHEYGHAIVARWFGDRTAEKMGRLTLNPLAHIDPMGMLMVVLVGFGYAKPVPTDSRQYRSHWGEFFVAAAGPMMNLLIALVSINLYAIGYKAGIPLFQGQAAFLFFNYLATINLLLMLFNLIPIGALDGHYLIPFLLPKNLAAQYQRLNAQYGNLLLLGLIVLAIMGVPVFNALFGWSQALVAKLILV